MKLGFKNLAGRIRSKTTVLIMGTFFVTGLATSVNAADAANGEALFKQNCAACHHPEKKVVGPALKGAKGRWEAEASADLYYEWIRNSAKLVQDNVPYAVKVFNDFNQSAMQAFPSLTNVQIDDITEYVETFSAGGGSAAGGTAQQVGPKPAEEEDNSNSIYWIFLLVAILILRPVIASNFNILATLNRMRRDKLNHEEFGYVPKADMTPAEMTKAWLNKNMGLVSVLVLIAVGAVLIQSYGFMKSIGVYEGYHPSQPIKFPHYVHAGTNQIDCEYCHNSASKSKHAGLPTVNICMNCHKAIQEGTMYGTEEIGKIHAAAGFDAANMEYTGETNPIVWNRVYVLPDHVYFNHSQHVKVAGLTCQNCHGKVEEMETVYLAPVDSLVKPDILEKPLTRPTLTMGWCIECHGEAKVQLIDNGGYYEEIHERLKRREDIMKLYKEDGKFTVEELGGWECAKCHY
jgi:mono/diheme cytochrome c family protein